ncbi:beta-1,3-galactosyl-O-glycosyl-glycoprotein beta-1,6-N-acetylglucosaminyltransferase-like [Mercenaria mercenaria]|uniref:beta-1,3-galactosyl-O-glycosyl-glycoprotein beta-1,6-N-acetylglucosaminyltransferase-like n=1 Tax=Mercenaria mercenaria TaxID=6596 RepID=UPI00234F7C0A|nr:beta-1,3-galactosyl-O-glycosyl-glycoprotein beta-1,6-N-acetylglucosaminyltransferase-like [Mercenaria mercenaria]
MADHEKSSLNGTENFSLSKSLDISKEQNPEARKYFARDMSVKGVDCMEIIRKNKNEIDRALRRSEILKRNKVSDLQYTEKTNNCAAFIADRGYITNHLTEEEKNFPVAYSILMYKNVEQFERLLRAIYRPQNIYCIHVDSKSNSRLYQAVSGIANCFDNVHLLQKRINVRWGYMSVLEPELLCMKELWKRSKTWKYFINLTGQEFPLKTNYELVQILKAYNGANDVETTVKRFQGRCQNTKAGPPHGIQVAKGALHIAVNRGFVDYSLHDKRARDILAWMNVSCWIPDEVYFSTLNHNPHLGVPGSYKGHPETTRLPARKKPYLARFKNRVKSDTYRYPCHGKVVRGICIFGIGDVPMLSKRKELFANKFHLDYQTVAYECMEELIFNRTRDEYLGTRVYNANWYSKLGFVSKKIDL